MTDLLILLDTILQDAGMYVIVYIYIYIHIYIYRKNINYSLKLTAKTR